MKLKLQRLYRLLLDYQKAYLTGQTVWNQTEMLALIHATEKDIEEAWNEIPE